MPEGDTIFRAARALHRAFAGHVVAKFESVLPKLSRVDLDSGIVGRRIEKVEAEGKWMLMYFSGGLVLLTHMLMSGSWHIYRPGEAWQRRSVDMRILIETAALVAVGFNVPVAEFHTARSLARRPGFYTLGPSLLAEELDENTAAARLQSRPEAEIGVALLMQSLLSGIGNVYKSGIWSCPNPDWLCAISGGYAYLIDVAHPENFTMLRYRPVLDVHCYLPGKDCTSADCTSAEEHGTLSEGFLLFVGHRTILAWSRDGEAWESDRLSWEGITNLRIEGKILHGEGWDLITDKDLPFALELETGKRI